MNYYSGRRRSYYNRPYYKKKTYRRPLYTPARQEEHTFDIYEYLRKEFLNASNETLAQIIWFYKRTYGENASEYLRKSYTSWKNGSIRISQLTMDRIIECMPKFLNHEKRLYILRCEIHNFIEKAKQKLNQQNITLKKLHDAFELIQNEIINFSHSNLHWFIGKNIFQQDEIDYYLHVCKYALNERLVQSHRQTYNDLNLITDKLNSFNGNIESINYKIDFLNLRLDISDIDKTLVTDTPLKNVKFELNESFHKSFDKSRERYILDELMKMSFYEKEGEINASLKSQEISAFFSHFLSLTNGNHEIKMTTNFQGEGGVLSMELEFTPFKKSLETIIYSILTIILIIGGFGLVTYFVLYLKYYWIFAVLLLLLSSFLQKIRKEITKIQRSIIQIKQYG